MEANSRKDLGAPSHLSEDAAPEWSLAGYFASFTETEPFEASLAADIRALRARFEGAPPMADGGPWWSDWVRSFEDAYVRLGHLSSYAGCCAAADARSAPIAALESRVIELGAELSKVTSVFRQALGAVPAEVFEAWAAQNVGARYFLSRLSLEARLSMPTELEGLATDLGTTGISAWGRLYDAISGRLTYEQPTADGGSKTTPIAARRSHMADPDRATRQGAFERGNLAWESVGDTLSLCLNQMVKTRLILNERRGVTHFLDVPLFQAGISRRTLEALMDAVAEERGIPQRALSLKAKAMGQKAIAWFDLEAPFPSSGSSRSTWARGVGQVREAFSAYPKLGAYFEHVLASRWIDAAPSLTKRPGAFCTSSDVTNETRVFMTFLGSEGDVSTLAHEVGHAFHADVMRDLRGLARSYPMTLAETASTFAEALLAHSELAKATEPSKRIALLGKMATDAAAFLLDVPARFAFEKALYEARMEGELSTEKLCQMMVAAQRFQFGEVLEQGAEDPYFWASKLHFFIADLSFYNFPYTFGYLLSKALFRRYQEEGPSFFATYEAFLRDSGAAPAHEVLRNTLGWDAESKAFWVGAIRTLTEPLDELERLLTVEPRGA